jgi:flagellar biosynthesis GTPase FlhF
MPTGSPNETPFETPKTRPGPADISSFTPFITSHRQETSLQTNKKKDDTPTDKRDEMTPRPFVAVDTNKNLSNSPFVTTPTAQKKENAQSSLSNTHSPPSTNIQPSKNDVEDDQAEQNRRKLQELRRAREQMEEERRLSEEHELERIRKERLEEERAASLMTSSTREKSPETSEKKPEAKHLDYQRKIDDMENDPILKGYIEKVKSSRMDNKVGVSCAQCLEWLLICCSLRLSQHQTM